MAKPKDGCVQPAGGVIGVSSDTEAAAADAPRASGEEMKRVLARVGQPAPDFEASAYIDGGFDNIKLSDYKGKWVVLCFYPGDFTFV